MRLLLVDDDPGLRTLVRATFDEVDFEIVEAASAAEARAAVAERIPDVIVLDVRMPGESGMELCRELKQHPRTASARVILLSGSHELASREADRPGDPRAWRKQAHHRERSHRLPAAALAYQADGLAGGDREPDVVDN